MFRVPVDTVLRRAAVTSMLVLTATFAACGGDGDSGADSAASNDGQSPLTAAAPDVDLAPTSVATTPEATPAPAPTQLPYKDFTKEEAAEITLKVDDSETIAAASTKKISAKVGGEQAKATLAMLRDADIDATGTTGGTKGLLATVRTTNPTTTILFYDNARNAARANRNWQNLIGLNPGSGRADRIGRHVYTRGLKDRKWTEADLKAFEEFKAMVEEEV